MDPADSVKSPKVLKKEEKARIQAEKKAKKEAEKAAKKAEKDRILAEKKAKKEAKKKGRDSVAIDSSSAASSDETASDRGLGGVTLSPGPKESTVDRSPTPETPRSPGSFSVLSAGQAPSPEAVVLPVNGIGRLGQAWITGHPGEELGLTSYAIKPEALTDSDFNNLGEGVFGLVYECGMARDGVNRLRDGNSGNAIVVVKSLSKDAGVDVAADFAAEAAAMEKLDHPNILRILGSSMDGETRIMVYEGHAHGVLNTFLLACKTTGKLSALDQARMAHDVASGVAYLHELGSVHRDLAARNCLVTEDNTIRVGDFGLSQVKCPGDYHAIDGVPLPVRWMAPESFRDRLFNPATDVWSIGVLIWEIVTHGTHPFPKLASGDVAGEVLKGGTNDAPKDCNEGLATALASCQSAAPAKRPDASALRDTLEKLVDDLTKEASEAPRNGTGRNSNGYANPADSLTSPTPGEAQPKDGKTSKPSSRFDKLKTNKKSFRSLGQFKDAENPSEALEAVASKNKAIELDMNKITVSGELGQGAFGVVVKGKLVLDDGTTVPCACKTLKDRKNAEDLDALEAEAELVSQFDHENVVKCFGKVTLNDPAMIIFEFMSNGSLFSYLQDLPETPKLQRLMKMAIDIANGMAYLADGNNVHRDLATRNVLVNEELTCKISDFGLSRDLDDDTYYESDGGMVPIRWTPPEAYKYKKYSTSSDVWSYGITLYEVWTKGGLPYGRKWTNMNVMMEVEKGYRLPAPAKCPKAVYQLMLKCWNPLRKMRPSFGSIKEQLEMAYDMMFPAEDEQVAEEEVEVDTEYGDMDQMYYGMDVPTEENLDTYLDNPSPVPSPQKSAVKAAAATLGDELKYLGKDVEAKPDRFAHILKGNGNGSNLNVATNPANPSSDPFSSPVLAMRRDKGSLRKQKAAAVEEGAPSSRDTVDMSSASRVADMINMSKAKEEISAAELTGIAKLQKAGVVAPKVEPNAYVETVGRAVEELAEVKMGKRKRCVCRRFKCVCGAK
eukprot:m.435749 g.435749  ORF g.435749 m.435749 type:complete len:1008 (+) comp17886_c0_seq1:364-3387(+)